MAPGLRTLLSRARLLGSLRSAARLLRRYALLAARAVRDLADRIKPKCRSRVVDRVTLAQVAFDDVVYHCVMGRARRVRVTVCRGVDPPEWMGSTCTCVDGRPYDSLRRTCRVRGMVLDSGAFVMVHDLP